MALFANQFARCFAIFLAIAGLEVGSCESASAAETNLGVVVHGQLSITDRKSWDVPEKTTFEGVFAGPRWIYQTQYRNPFQIVASDGVDSFSVISFLPEFGLTNTGDWRTFKATNREWADAREGTFPQVSWWKESVPWIAFGSESFLKAATDGFMPNIFPLAQTNRVRFEALFSDARPAVLESLRVYHPPQMLDLSASAQAARREGKTRGPFLTFFPPPYDRGYVAVEYKPTSFTNIGPFTIPAEFRVERRVLVKQPDDTYVLTNDAIMLGKVLSLALTNLSTPLMPPLTANMNVQDHRKLFDRTIPPYPATEYGWLSRSDPNLKKKVLELTKRRGEEEYLPVGSPAPEFVYDLLREGAKEPLMKHRGKVVVLEFWASWCAPCQKGMDDIQKLILSHPEWKGQVEIIGVSVDKTRDLAVAHLKKKQWDKTRNAWAGPTALNLFRGTGIPRIYILDQKGNVVAADHHLDVEATILPLLDTLR